MPIIPTFNPEMTVPTPQGGALADPNAFAQKGAALASAAGEVGGALQEANARYDDAKRQAQASDLSAQASQGYDQLRQKWSLVPDRAAAQAGFNDEAAKLKSATLGQAQDPLVAGYLTPHLDQMGMIYSAQVGQESFRRESSAQASRLDQNGIDAQNRIAANPNPLARSMEIDNYTASLSGAAQAGWITPEEAQARGTAFRFKISQDDVMRDSAADPVATYNTLSDPALRAKAYPYLPPEYADHFAWRLEGRAMAAAGHQIGQSILGGVGAPQPPAQDATLANNVGNLRATNTAWDGKGNPIGGFETFATPEQGIAATTQNIVAQTGKLGPGATLGQLIGRWAPAGDGNNDPDAYAAKVAAETGIGVNDPVPIGDPAKMTALVKAMTRVEKGGVAFDDGTFMRGVTAGLASHGGGQVFPDFDAIEQETLRRTADQPYQVQQSALATVQRAKAQYLQETAGMRAQVQKSFGDTEAALEAGKDDVQIPYDDITRAYPVAIAHEMIDKLELARTAGQMFSTAQWASPADVAAMRDDLASGLGPRSAMMRTRAGIVWQPGDDGATPPQFEMRQQLVARLDKMLAARSAALTADPAGYAAGNPMVQQAFARTQSIPDSAPDADAQRAAAYGDYAQKTLAVQQQLGVPDYAQHVLSAGTAHAVAQQLTTADPAKVDVGQQIDAMAKNYPPEVWPKVWGDLVTLGKLPREYQMLGAMDAPGQAPARADLTRAMQFTAQRGGMAELEKAAPPDQVRAINQNLDAAIEPFRQTASVPGVNGNIQQINDVRDTVRQLATFYAIQGTDGPSAVAKAADGILGQKYDFDGTMRVPKGQLGQVQQAGASVLASLRPADLAPFPATGAPAVDAQRSADAMRLVKTGAFWVTNSRDDGVVAYVRPRDGSVIPVTLANGRPLEMKFNALPQPVQPVPQQQSAADAVPAVP